MSASVQQAVPKLRASEVWALYGGELEYCLGGDEGEDQEAEGFDQQSECRDGPASACEPCSSFPSAPEYELITEDAQGPACLSTQDYYSHLEALKRMHLQDMADLKVMHMSDLSAGNGKVTQGTQLNDKEEIASAQDDSEALPGDTSCTIPCQELKPQQKSVSESDTPENGGMEGEKERKEEKEKEEKEKEAAEPARRQSGTDGVEAQSLKPAVQTEPSAASKAVGAASKHRSRATSRRSSGAELSGRGNSRLVTVPKPFQMMLREEDKKRRNVKTRSEVEMENELLRRELEELRQCRRQFRATPAPPSTHLPFRGPGRRSRPASLDRASDSSAGSTRRSRSCNTSPQPFSFLERERKKREQKLEEALKCSSSSREDHWVFKARRLPRMYKASCEEYELYGMHTQGDDQREHLQPRGHTASSELLNHAGGRLEREQCCMGEKMGKKAEDRDGRQMLDNSNWRLRRKPSLGTKGLLVEGDAGGLRRVRERDWSYIHPIQRTCINLNLAASLSGSSERLPARKGDYISV